MICNKCGQQFEGNAAFCPYCGAPVEQAVQQAQQYTQQMQPQQSYVPQNSAPQNDGGKKTLLIVGIIIGIALLIVGIIVIVLLLKKDDDKDDNKKTTTEAVTETETQTEEPTTEAVTEATPDEPAPVPYGEEQGIELSGIGTEAKGTPFIAFARKEDADKDSNTRYGEIDDVSVESASYNSFVKDVLVSEPDSDGNVIYTVDIRVHHDYNVLDNSEESWYVRSHEWRPRAFDYYTGTILDDGDYMSNIAEEADFGTTKITYDDKETEVKTCLRSDNYNGDYEKEDTALGTKYTFNADSKYVISYKVPQDYDGVVIALYNGDVDAEEYNKSWDLEGKSRFVDSSGAPIRFFDEDIIGYTKSKDTNIFVKISDVARSATPEAMAEAYSSIGIPAMYYFDWTEEAKNGDYSMGGKTITDPAELGGWWQCYMLWDPENEMDSYGEELMNVEITANGSSIDWKDDYYQVRWGDSEEWTSKEDDEDVTITGTFNSDGTLSFDPATVGMNFEMYGFYTDGYCQYAVGWLTAQSGESAWVFLYRP